MDYMIQFLNLLEKNKIHYRLEKRNEEFITVEIMVPAQRWEVEFSKDEMRIEKFESQGMVGEQELAEMIQQYSL